MQNDLAHYSARLREAGNAAIEVRVGVNTGEVVVRSIATGAGQAEYTPIGHTINLASRASGLGSDGSAVVNESTVTLRKLHAQGAGCIAGKRDNRAVNVYEVTGLGSSECAQSSTAL
jgi:class 3 adenylate cyclase